VSYSYSASSTRVNKSLRSAFSLLKSTWQRHFTRFPISRENALCPNEINKCRRQGRWRLWYLRTTDRRADPWSYSMMYTDSKKYVVRWDDCKISMSLKKFPFLVGSLFKRARKWTWWAFPLFSPQRRGYGSYLHSWFSIFPCATQVWAACSPRKRPTPQWRSHSLPMPESNNLVSGRD
jgi:hypothetical protein